MLTRRAAWQNAHLRLDQLDERPTRFDAVAVAEQASGPGGDR